jgi:hypothetical protein
MLGQMTAKGSNNYLPSTANNNTIEFDISEIKPFGTHVTDPSISIVPEILELTKNPETYKA